MSSWIALGSLPALFLFGSRRSLRPAVAVRGLVTAMAFVGLTTIWLLGAMTLRGLARAPVLQDHLGWCATSHPFTHNTPVAVSAGAAVALAYIIFRCATTIPVWVLRHGPCDDLAPLRVVPTTTPIAEAEPGSPGRILVSTAVLDALTTSERRAVFAHEHAHLKRGHHRLVTIAAASAIANPLVRPLVGTIRHLIERWADEDAAAEIGDRPTVASAMAKVASMHPASAMLGFGDTGVQDRIVHLLDPHPPSDTQSVAAHTGLAVTVLAAAITSFVGLAQLVAVVLHICGSG